MLIGNVADLACSVRAFPDRHQADPGIRVAPIGEPSFPSVDFGLRRAFGARGLAGRLHVAVLKCVETGQ